jgi:hypothetical protein
LPNNAVLAKITEPISGKDKKDVVNNSVRTKLTVNIFSLNEVGILLILRLQTAVIQKAGGPLGLSIVGGIDHTSHPFGLEEPGIFISKVGSDC